MNNLWKKALGHEAAPVWMEILSCFLLIVVFPAIVILIGVATGAKL